MLWRWEENEDNEYYALEWVLVLHVELLALCIRATRSSACPIIIWSLSRRLDYFRARGVRRMHQFLNCSASFKTLWELDKNSPQSNELRNERVNSHSTFVHGKYFVRAQYCVRAQSASQQNLLPVKIFCPDMIFRFFYISSRRNIVLGDSLPWTNMDWLSKLISLKAF